MGGPIPSSTPTPSAPGRKITFWISFFLGLFGLIPAYTNAKKANALGLSGKPYYLSFFYGITAFFVLVVVAPLALIVMIGIFAGDPTTADVAIDTPNVVQSEQPATPPNT